MASSSNKPNYHLDLGQIPPLVPNPTRSASSTAASSPIDAPAGSAPRYPIANGSNSSNGANGAGLRGGTGSPSHEPTSRFFRRGVTHTGWGPPTASGLSTPLRETIPESPDGDTFPDGTAPVEALQRKSSLRVGSRARSGTAPSRWPSGPIISGPSLFASQTAISSQPTPSHSPFRPGTALAAESTNAEQESQQSFSSSLSRPLSRKHSLLSNSSSFGGSSLWSNWNGPRNRSSTVTGLITNFDSRPRSHARKESLTDADIKTLDYLGLDDPPSATLPPPDLRGLHGLLPMEPLGNGNSQVSSSIKASNNRFRSFSVNAKEQYATPTDEDIISGAFHSGTLTPAIQNPTQAEILQHNLEVQAFANQASSSRPRALTAGLLESKGWNQFDSASRINIETDEYREALRALRTLDLQANGAPGLSSFDYLQGVSNGEVTSSLWLGNVPSSTAHSTLEHHFAKYGKIDSVRVLSQKGCGFVNFESVQSAIIAKLAEEGKEIFPGAGPLRIGYAKAPSSVDNAEVRDSGSQASVFGDAHQTNGMKREKSQSSMTAHPSQYRDDLVDLARELGANMDEQRFISSQIDRALQFNTLAAPIPPYSDGGQHNLMHDSSKLRDIRKRIDNNMISQQDLDNIAREMLPEIVELSFNWLGNMVVQKLFDYCSEPLRDVMTRSLAPRLAELGVHKNGTYVAQKVMDLSISQSQRTTVIDYIRPYSLPLFQDTCGNYVMQKCLPFTDGLNQIVFDPMIARPLDLGCDHFGARAMRGSLESKNTAKHQQRTIAAVIVYHCLQLATNPDGSLLLTWYLETCDLPNKLKVLSDRLVRHMVQMCTSKTAHVTVQKIINQRHEPGARELLLQALFFGEDDSTLKEILRDPINGAPCIQRIMATPILDVNLRADMTQKVRDILLEIGVQPNQGYKKLMDDVGLSTRGSRDQSHGNSPARGNARHGRGNPGNPQNAQNQLINGNMSMLPNGMNGVGYHTPMGPTMTANANLPPYANIGVNGQGLGQNMVGPVTPPGRHMQYPQTLSGNARPNGAMNYPTPAVTSYSSPIPHQHLGMYSQGNMNSPQHFSMGPSPISPQGYGMQNGYSPMGMGVGGQIMWPQQQYAGFPMSPQMQGSPLPGGRRGRR